MAYFPPLQSDQVSTQVLSATEMAGAGVATSALDVAGYSHVDFTVNITNRASVTQIALKTEGSEVSNPSSSHPHADWFSNQDLSSLGNGAYSSLDHSVIYAISDTGKYVFSVPVTGIKMRAVIYATAGSATGSSFQVYASRRV